MRPYDIIRKTRDGIGLSREEISFLIDGYVREDIEDYQMAAWAMAVFPGMKTGDCLAHRGHGQQRHPVDLSGIEGIKVDKHAPAASAIPPWCWLPGSGSGSAGSQDVWPGSGPHRRHPDKLESFPGFQVNLSMEDFVANVNKTKCQ